jgi:hypothetical protein
MVACQGVAGRRLLDQIGEVLDPLARQHRGANAHALRPVLAEAWRRAFRAELPEPALSRCAAAIGTGQPWQLALWSNDWH